MNLFERFEVLEDPRDIRGKKYKLIDILIMTIYGLLCDLKDFTNIADFMKLKEEYFTKLLKLENGTPSHDCLSDLFVTIDSKKFMEIFIEWTKDIIKSKSGKNISIDGKAVKNATDKLNNGNIPYIVSAFIGEVGLSIGQVKVDDKSNEITAIPELLDLLEIEGATITIDAIGTQEEIVNKIVDKKAHYVLPVKDNQKELRKQIQSQFESYNNLYGNLEVMHKKTLEVDHGRTEEREYFLTYNVSKIENKEKWKTVNAIAYTRVSRIEDNETVITDNYYIIDYQITMDNLIEAIRDHWNIECGLHWRLDVILDEDYSRNRVKNSINNLAIMRKIVFNLASLDNRFGKVPLQRKLTRYVLDFTNIEKLIFEVIPSIS
jgi:predicted transposase YbfD/YdcC